MGRKQERIDRAEDVLAEHLRRWDAGEERTLEQLCAQHPEIEAELRAAHAEWIDFGRRLREESSALFDPREDKDFGQPDHFDPRRPHEPIAAPRTWTRWSKRFFLAALIIAIFLLGVGQFRSAVEPYELYAARGGGQIEADPLFLGPNRVTVDLTFRSREAEDRTGQQLRVVTDLDGTSLPGFRAEWTGLNAIRLHASDVKGFCRERVRLEPLEGRAQFLPFTLVFLGHDAWRIDGVGFGRRSPIENPESRLAVDPEGLEISAWIGGAGQSEIERLSVRSGDGASRRMLIRERGPQSTRYGLGLVGLNLKPGPIDLSFDLRDAAGREERSVLSVDIVVDPLTVDVADVFLRTAGGELTSATRTEKGVVLAQGEAPVLVVETRRVSDLEWRLFVGEASEPVETGRSSHARIHEVSLSAQLEAIGSESRRARLEYLIDEDQYVIRSPASSRGRHSGSVDVLRSAGRANFYAFLASGSRRLPLESGTQAFTNGLQTRLLLQNSGVVASRLFVHLEDPNGRLQPMEPRTIDPGKSLELPLEFSHSGIHRLSVQSFQIDPRNSATVDRPDEVQTFQVVVDGEAPTLILESERDLWTEPTDAGRIEFIANLQYESARDAGVHALDCKLFDVREERIERRSWRLEGEAPFSIELEGIEDDGRYAVQVGGTDLAGNALEVAEFSFEVARRGPDIELLRASGELDAGVVTDGGHVWQPDSSGLWSFQLRIEDPNGIALVEGILRGPDRELGIVLSGSGGIYDGRIELDPSWSQAKVALQIFALDRYANESALKLDDLRLPPIRPTRVARVELLFDGIPVNAMRRVSGNGDYVYVFGGRGDAVENELFLAAGLVPLNPDPDHTPTLSFARSLEPGDVADFYLDEYEVSNAEYLAFVLSPTGFAAAGNWPSGSPAPSPTRAAELLVRLRDASGHLPVHGVSWDEASAYAHWVDKRLPTWHEWELAVRGGARYRPYAAWRGTANALFDGTAPTPHSRGQGEDLAGDTGLRDLCSNLSEWTDSPCSAEDGSFWIAGGSFRTAAHDFAVVDDRPRTWHSVDVGFRCAQSALVVERRVGNPATSEIPAWRSGDESEHGGSR